MCAFFDELSALESAKPGRVHFNFDGEPGGKMSNLKAVIAGVHKDAHLYCCGPVPMLKAYEEAGEALGWPSSRVHLEYFSAKEEAALGGGFTVVCSKSGQELAIAPGQTILDALLDAGLEIEYSCFEGVCGTCEVRVLEGTPDHRDSVLSPEQKAANDRMFVCCSGSRTPRLVLDI
jgi:vanillate O-demethylase ferredoxin subunit